MSKETIYILKLQNDKYYVGKSSNPLERIRCHFIGKGAVWTHLYPPKSVDQMIEVKGSFDEDYFVKEYMKKYGINNVRGGSYCQEVLETNQIVSLVREMRDATNCCLKCGDTNHFIKECKNEYNSKLGLREYSLFCVRCGRSNHEVGQCFATKDIDGEVIEPVSFSSNAKVSRSICNLDTPSNDISLSKISDWSYINFDKVTSLMDNISNDDSWDELRIEQDRDNLLRKEKIEEEQANASLKELRKKLLLKGECVLCQGIGHDQLKCPLYSELEEWATTQNQIVRLKCLNKWIIKRGITHSRISRKMHHIPIK